MRELSMLLMALSLSCFTAAAIPLNRLNIRFEWLGVVFLILSLLVNR